MILRKEIDRILVLGIIEVSQSDWSSPMILIESPPKDPRLCIEYRALNAKTRIEFFPLPQIEKLVEMVRSASYITVMDLTKGYFKVPISQPTRCYAAFVTQFGCFFPTKMMLGLLNSEFYFCKMIIQVLNGLEEFLLFYVNNISIFLKKWSDHLKHIDLVLTSLRAAGLKVEHCKCVFVQKTAKFLGHEVGEGKKSPK